MLQHYANWLIIITIIIIKLLGLSWSTSGSTWSWSPQQWLRSFTNIRVIKWILMLCFLSIDISVCFNCGTTVQPFCSLFSRQSLITDYWLRYLTSFVHLHPVGRGWARSTWPSWVNIRLWASWRRSGEISQEFGDKIGKSKEVNFPELWELSQHFSSYYYLLSIFFINIDVIFCFNEIPYFP